MFCPLMNGLACAVVSAFAVVSVFAVAYAYAYAFAFVFAVAFLSVIPAGDLLFSPAPTTLSSRPERNEVERPAVAPAHARAGATADLSATALKRLRSR